MHGLAVKVGTHGGGSVKGFQRIIIIIIIVIIITIMIMIFLIVLVQLSEFLLLFYMICYRSGGDFFWLKCGINSNWSSSSDFSWMLEEYNGDRLEVWKPVFTLWQGFLCGFAWDVAIVENYWDFSSLCQWSGVLESCVGDSVARLYLDSKPPPRTVPLPTWVKSEYIWEMLNLCSALLSTDKVGGI